MARGTNTRNTEIQKIVEKIIEQRTIENITQEEISISFPLLQKAANEFLIEINIASNSSSHQTLMQKLQAITDKIKLLYGNMRASSTYTQQVLAAQHKFENALNNFLKRKIYLTYVEEDGNIIAYDEVAIEQIYQQATGNVGRGNINPNILKNITNVNNDTTSINKEIQKSVAKRQQVYLTAIQRWEENEEEKNKKYNPSFHTFYWRLFDDRHITGWTNKIDSRGVIAEGYAEAVINNEKDVLNTSIESSLFNLWHNYIKKDSIPAAVKGDITLKDDGSMQFAIKEGQFSTAKVGQYINLAYNITQLSNNITRQNFYLALPKLLSLGKTSSKIVDILNSEAEDIVFQLVKANLQGKKINSNQWNATVEILKN